VEAFPVPSLKFVTVHGTPLAYVERGNGEPVVFVHGSAQDLRTWLPQLDACAASGRAIIYSRRYARPNDDIPPGQDDPMPQHVDDLMALLDALDARPAHLVGTSWGGFISLLVAMRAPDAVRSLVLCEAPVLPLFISNNPGPAELLRLFLRRPVDAFRIARFGVGVVEPTAKAYREGDLKRAHEIFGTAMLGKEGFASLPPDRQRMLDENANAEKAQMLGEGFPPVRADDVRAVRTPALILAGERGPAVLGKTVNGELARLLPNARRAVIPDAAHIMHEDNPDVFNATVQSFWDGLTANRHPK
jgi:pimeloyl-ACP methyl ester carboxylesterase